MADSRLLILFNPAVSTEKCRYCHKTMHLRVQYGVFAQRADEEAQYAKPVCASCARKREPALLEMLDLYERFQEFNQVGLSVQSI
jgi:hypothetical protein